MEVLVRCQNCKKERAVDIGDRLFFNLKFKCTDCGGPGQVNSDWQPKYEKVSPKARQKNNQLAAFDGVHCLSCGEEIPEKRLKALPGTKLCVDCAASNPNENNRKRIAEPLGSRDDYKRDRARSKFDSRRK